MRPIALLVCLAAVPATAAAQGPALALARVCVSEAGWQSVQSGDCAAIAHVLRRRSSVGRVTRGIVCQYSPRSCNKRRRVRRWIAHLRPDMRRPDYWPRGSSWARRRPAWRETLAHAARLVRGERLDRCRRPPDHWGARWFTVNARRYGWERVQCGPTLNAYWRIP